MEEENIETPAEEYKTITAEEFKAILRGEREEYITLKQLLVNDYEKEYYGKVIVIKKIKVSEHISLGTDDNSAIQDYPHPIQIISGVFNVRIVGGNFLQEIIIQGGTFGYFFIDGGTYRGGLTIKDSTFNGIRFQNVTFHRPLIIYGNLFENYFHIYDGEFNHEVYISGKFKRELTIYDGTFKEGLKIGYGTYHDAVTIFGGTFQNSFIIATGTFKDNFSIYAGTFNKGFEIQGGSFETEVIIGGGIFKNPVLISGGIFEEKFIIYEGTFERAFRLVGGTFNKWFWIWGGDFNNIYFYFETLKINCLVFGNIIYAKSILIQFSDEHPKADNELNWLVFAEADLPATCTLKVRDVDLAGLYFSGFNNMSSANFSGINFRPSQFQNIPEEEFKKEMPTHQYPASNTIHIHNSDLGRSTFINCDFKGMDIKFRNSKVTEIFLAGTQMPKEIMPENPQQAQLGYGQLKKVYENMGDSVRTNLYYSQEMSSYYDQLNWGVAFWEKINLWFNNWSSNHGQSWKRGLLSTIIVALIFYIPYCWSIGYFPSSGAALFTWQSFFHCAARLLEFINPIHKNDFFVDDKQLRSWAHAIDSISRIFLAYFIYQLIQAFRKHGKK